MPNTSTADPKFAQYLEELNTLNEKYQYSLVAKIKVTETGITPYLAKIDLVPPKTVAKKTVAKKTVTKKGKKK